MSSSWRPRGGSGQRLRNFRYRGSVNLTYGGPFVWISGLRSYSVRGRSTKEARFQTSGSRVRLSEQLQSWFNWITVWWYPAVSRVSLQYRGMLPEFLRGVGACQLHLRHSRLYLLEVLCGDHGSFPAVLAANLQPNAAMLRCQR